MLKPAVVPAKAGGPIITGHRCYGRWGHSLRDKIRSWLWVPAQGRDDKRLKSASIRKMFLICSVHAERVRRCGAEHGFTAKSHHQSAGPYLKRIWLEPTL